MGYRYDFRPLDDLLIAAGVDLLPAIKEKAAKDLKFDTSLSVSQISKEAFSDLEDDYESHASKVSNPKYGQYLKLVDENIGLIKSTAISSEEREAIKNKLDELIDLDREDRKFQAKTFPKISKFLHKLGQLLFKSHRFQTKGEHGVQLVVELGNVEQKILTKELGNLIKGRKASIPFKKFMNQVNALDDTQFKELLKVYYKSHSSSRSKFKPYEFYSKLTSDKKEMVAELYENHNWYNQVFSILKGRTSKEINEFISENMIDHLRSNVNPFFHVWSSERYHKNDPIFENFVELIIVRAVRKCLKEDDNNTIEEFISDEEFGASVRMMLSNNLTQEEINKVYLY